MRFPVLNRQSSRLLAGLVFRAFAPEAPGESADLIGRRIDILKGDRTTQMLELSGLKADVETALRHQQDCRDKLREAQLDLELHNQENPVPEPRKGLFGRRRPDREQQQAEQTRSELQQIAAEYDLQLKEKSEIAAALKKRADKLSEDLQLAETDLVKLLDALDSRLALDVIDLLAAGQHGDALALADRAKQSLRISLTSVAVEIIAVLLARGPGAAKARMLDSSRILEQYGEPVQRLLEHLIGVVEYGESTQQKSRSMMPRAFSSAGLNRLWQMASVLSGASVPAANDLYSATISNLEAALRASTNGATVAASVGSQDLICRTLAAYTLICSGNPGAVAEVAGVSWHPQQDSRGKPVALPQLMDQIRGIAVSDWPQAHIDCWRNSLACMILFACSSCGPQESLGQWLAESYGFEKTPLYWWVLSEVKQDPSLLRNIGETENALFVPVQL